MPRAVIRLVHIFNVLHMIGRSKRNERLYDITPNGMLLNVIIGNLDIFHLILPSDILNINKLTVILKMISQSDIKCIMTLSMNTIASVLKVSTYIITSITARPIRLAVILAVMSVSAIIIVVIYTCMYMYIAKKK